MADVNSKGRNKAQLFAQTHSCDSDSRTKAQGTSVSLRHRKEEIKAVHTAGLLCYASPTPTSNISMNRKWKFKRGGVSTNTENIRALVNTSFYFPVCGH